jgi:hypothetical protein
MPGDFSSHLPGLGLNTIGFALLLDHARRNQALAFTKVPLTLKIRIPSQNVEIHVSSRKFASCSENGEEGGKSAWRV